MSKLGFLDQFIYKMETGGMAPMYMCGAMILDPSTAEESVDVHAIAHHIAACFEEVPLMRQKLVQDPLKLSDLRLVDDQSFNVYNHISISSLPGEGGYEELTQHLARFSARHLDLRLPLWRVEVIDKLADGKIAVALHMHHSIADGIGAQRALASLWSTKPSPARKAKSKPWKYFEQPSGLQLAKEAVLETAHRVYVKAPLFLYRNSSTILKKMLQSATTTLRTNNVSTGTKLPKVRKTSLNIDKLSPKRAVSYVEFPLAEIKAAGKHFQSTVNDLALCLSSAALQHYFEKTGEKIDFDIIAAILINKRAEGDSSAGNALALSRLNLHNNIKDLGERIAAIKRDTAIVKNNHRGQSDNTEEIDSEALTELFSPLFIDALVFGIIKFNLLNKAPLVNVVITNIPGSPVPMYMGGAKQVSTVPMAPIAESLALTISITSTEELFIIGYHGCGDAIHDIELFSQGTKLALGKLKASMNGELLPQNPKTTKKRANRPDAKIKRAKSTTL